MRLGWRGRRESSCSPCLPLSVLFGGLLLTVSTYARNQKEAQTILGPLFTLIMVPAVMSTVVTDIVPRTVALVPVLNAALDHQAGTWRAGSTSASSRWPSWRRSCTPPPSLLLATRLFQNEAILIKA